MDTSTSTVIDKMEHRDENPLEYDELVAAWNTLCEQSWTADVDDFQFADIENAAISALSDEPSKERSGHIGNEISRMLSSFDYPTFLVSRDARVAAINTAGSVEFDLHIGDTIDLLPYALDGSQKISALVKESLDTEEQENLDATLKRGHGKDDDRDATIAITASLGPIPTALVFVVTTKWKPRSAELLQKQFNLTDTEAEVLVSFINGYSSQDIAQQRTRSHATIRTQLQSILAKSGARNQTELLRLSLSVSDFMTNIGVIGDAVHHPYRRRAEILREGGRFVEITLMGDLRGDPIVTVANAANYTFNAKVEQQLFDKGLCLISVCAPGCGRTDPPPEGKTRLDYLSGDVAAVLDQLGIAKSPVMVYNVNSAISYAMTNKVQSRVSHVIQIAACAPLRFLTTPETQSPWVSGILRASVSHPAMKKILFKGAMRAWLTIGAKQFMRLQLSSNPADAEYMLAPENLVEYEHSLKTATAAGVSSAAEDIAANFEDWTAEIKALPVNITTIHGVEDKLVPIDIQRRFAAAFPEKIKLIEIENAGVPILQSHTDKAIGFLRSVVNSHLPE